MPRSFVEISGNQPIEWPGSQCARPKLGHSVCKSEVGDKSRVENQRLSCLILTLARLEMNLGPKEVLFREAGAARLHVGSFTVA